MKIYLDSVGCRLNQAEIETFARQFQHAGHVLVAEPEQADLAVVNTCAVTTAAESDSRQKIRRVARMKRSGRESGDPLSERKRIVVTGCWSTLRPREAAGLPGVVRVVSNATKDRLVADILEIPTEDFEREPLERIPVPGLRSRTRAFIKVQDGCNNRCAFCITTLARGKMRSRQAEEVLAEIQGVSSTTGQETHDAVLEAVLTGVHLGSWGQDSIPQQNLGDLVQRILRETSLPRLRLSSLEPWDLENKFFELWQDSRLCRHLHLPLQSGCAATLERMQRKTTPSVFTELVKTAREKIPGVAITTDVIVGFPGESEEEFEQSLEFVKQMDFAGGHVFNYSARPGTDASRMAGQVQQEVRKNRSWLMREALAESGRRYQAGFVGHILPVLWESALSLGADGWEMSGLSDNYLRVQARSSRGAWNKIMNVRIIEHKGEYLRGEILTGGQV